MVTRCCASAHPDLSSCVSLSLPLLLSSSSDESGGGGGGEPRERNVPAIPCFVFIVDASGQRRGEEGREGAGREHLLCGVFAARAPLKYDRCAKNRCCAFDLKVWHRALARHCRHRRYIPPPPVRATAAVQNAAAACCCGGCSFFTVGVSSSLLSQPQHGKFSTACQEVYCCSVV